MAGNTPHGRPSTLLGLPVIYADETVERRLLQVHWVNPLDAGQTAFVLQREVNIDDATEIHDAVRDRISECPEGWIPEIIGEEDPRFVRDVARCACLESGFPVGIWWEIDPDCTTTSNGAGQ